MWKWGLALLLLVGVCKAQSDEPKMSDERVVFQTNWGDIEFGFFPEEAPKTVAHIFKLCALGAYQSNHFFRVDKGFVAQTADVRGGRTIRMNAEQQEEADKNLPLEVVPHLKHHQGVLSMARGNDPNSGGSSFSVLLGDAPHLDMQYTVFGKVTKGMETLRAFEKLETTRQGIFVMPKERVTILGTYWYLASAPVSDVGQLASKGSLDGASGACEAELQDLRHRFTSQAEELQRVRKKCLPGR